MPFISRHPTFKVPPLWWILFGRERRHWFYLPVDDAEYLDPYYGRQN